ncbi:foldase protein PrsA [Aureitalea marina]|uniref:PpiC domain-containing protein n=1 Tax=Aureitalea marina TaxID=930804 RepID=A0A2S7KMU5_9FLAO|nr:peptidylprolyl isomerase [Aureitalea marina]PQB03947.1 hypothetical protein BST85_02765 [Aureitalea marina]
MKFALFSLSLLFFIPICAQQESDVLMTVGQMEITGREFLQVYQKNLNLVQDDQQRSMDGYMDLFVEYKLKVAEAYSMGLDTLPQYKKEFAKYEDQLARNYIYEDKMTDELVTEAYERGLEELDVDHILMLVGMNSLPQDTLKAYNKIESVRKKALAGENFTQLAKQYSEEPGAKETGGKLGYISVFATVYPFESAAYQIEVGGVSKIVRTQFGYHILKVNDRRAKSPDLVVSHIMVSDRQDAGTVDPEQRIREVYAQFEQGEEFEGLARQYSEDKGSARNGGQLRPFGRGSLRSKIFETKAYQLSEIGAVSGPFKSEFGWHIIRLDSLIPVKTFEEQKEDIKNRISQGNRAKVLTQNLVDRVKDQYGFQRKQSYLEPAMNWVTDSVMKRSWKATPLIRESDPVLFIIGDKPLRLSQYGAYLEQRQKRIKLPTQKGELLTQVYYEFEQLEIERFVKSRLEEDNEEYALVVNEYREGLLIFEVMNRSVWNEARTDSLGLEKFFKKNKKNYRWEDRLEAEIFSASDGTVLEEVSNRLRSGENAEEIRAALNNSDKVKVLYTSGVYEAGDSRLPDSYQMKEGVSSVLSTEDNFVLVVGKSVLPAGPKSLEEARGQVLSDYQVKMEEDWMEQLRKRYPVEIDRQVFDQLKNGMN